MKPKRSDSNYERQQFLKNVGWKWEFINPNPPAKPKPIKRKLFKDERLQNLRPSITMYRE